MSGIWVAVNATTSYAGSSRKTTLKSWKSRPAAPRMTTRRRRCGRFVVMSDSTAEVVRGDRHTLLRVVLAAGPASAIVPRPHGIPALRVADLSRTAGGWSAACQYRGVSDTAAKLHDLTHGTEHHLSLAEDWVAHNYHPLPVVIAHAEGAW